MTEEKSNNGKDMSVSDSNESMSSIKVNTDDDISKKNKIKIHTK